MNRGLPALTLGIALLGCSASCATTMSAPVVAPAPDRVPVAQLEMSPFAFKEAREPPVGLRYLSTSEIRRLFRREPLQMRMLADVTSQTNFTADGRFTMVAHRFRAPGTYTTGENKLCLLISSVSYSRCMFFLAADDARYFIVDAAQPTFFVPVEIKRGKQ